MIKRVALFFMVVTAIPAVLVSLPVWADSNHLTITFKGAGEASSISVYTISDTRSPFAYFQGKIVDGWSGTTSEQRTEGSKLQMNFGGSTKTCSVNGRTDSVIPFKVEDYEGNEVIVTEVNVSISGAGCEVQVIGEEEPPVAPDEKGLKIYAYSDEEITLYAYDYNTSGTKLKSHDVDVYVGDEGVEKQLVLHADTSYTQIVYGTETCAYSNGIENITAPAEGESSTVYVQIHENICTLSDNAPVEPGEKQLNIYAYSDETIVLFAYDYKTEGERELGSHSVPVAEGDEGVETQLTLNAGTSYSQIVYGTETCAYPGGTETKITAPAEGESKSVHVQIKKSVCTLRDTPPAPIAIDDCTALQSIGSAEDKPSDGDYHLTDDLNCQRFLSIVPTFTGTISGEGKTIQMTMDESGNDGNHAMFRYFNGKIDNIKFTTVNIGSKYKPNCNSGNMDCRGVGDRGLIAGETNGATISNITVESLTIRGGHPELNNKSGGIVGIAKNTTLSNVHIDGLTIMKPAHAGGLVGSAENTIITKSSVNGMTTEETDCFNKNGNSYYGQNEDCGVGGLIGLVSGAGGSITESTVKEGRIDTKRNAGGLVGLIHPGTTNFTITNSYSTIGLHNINRNAGGLIGASDATTQETIKLYQIYAAGQVGGSNCSGCNGVLGGPGTTVGLASCSGVFDTETTGRKTSGDKNNSAADSDCRESVGKTTQAMENSGTYNSNWLTNIWCIVTSNDAYPKLRWEVSDTTSCKD